MPRSRYAGRIATLYFHSNEELSEWSEAAKAYGCSLSNYILEMVGKARDLNSSAPMPDIAKDVEEMRRELRTLRKDGREKELLLEHYETELFKLRSQVFSEPDGDGQGEYDPRLITLLRQGKTLDSYRLLQDLGIDHNDSEAVRLISNQLEELRRFGLLKETANGWRWL